jgi:hemerythrin-like domain-containing protein
MLAEHDEGRAYLKAVRESLAAAEEGSEEARERALENAEAYIGLLRSHIYKEDNILFRIAQTVLGPEDVRDLDREFARVEIPERYREPAGLTA